MLEVFSNFLCYLMMAIISCYFIKKVTKYERKIVTIKNILLILILTIIETFLYKVQYTGIQTIVPYILNVIIYSKVFKIPIQDIIIVYGILMLALFAIELLFSLTFLNFIDVNTVREFWYIKIGINLTYVSAILIVTKLCRKKLQKIYLSVHNNITLTNTVFVLMSVICLSCLIYNITKNFSWSYQDIVNITVMVSCLILASIFINEKINYNEKAREYDLLFNYVQNFEEWIEKEQLNRHEYKNQLAVLRCLTKDKKVKSKIDEILEDSINIEGEVINQLKTLPKGGLKGLMYYKAAIAQKNKINLTINVSLDAKTKLNKLSEKDIRVLCKLIGIYFDNAIEAARETRKKIVLIEIYEFKDKVKFVFSNTFKKSKNIEKRNEKGVSTKGEGHGNGLYFASKLIFKNKWLDQKQDIVDKYYIQELIVINKESIY